MENWRKRFIITVGFIEALLFSGSLFGWASLVHVLQQEGVYTHLCVQKEVGLKSVESEINNETSFIDFSESIGNVHSDFSSELLYAMSSTTPIFDMDSNNSTSYYLKDLPQSYTNITLSVKQGYKEILRCTAQDNEFALIYTVAAVMYGLTSVLIGFSLDYFGLWVTRISASVMASAGFFCLAFASEEQPWLLWPALNLIGLGTNQLRLSCFQFANLYPNQRATIILLYSAAYSISTVMFLIVQYGYEAGVSFKTGILLLGGISFITFPVTFFMPKMKIENEEIRNEINNKQRISLRTDQNLNDSNKMSSGWLSSIEKATGLDVSETLTNEIPLGTSLCTLSSFLHFYWQFINSLIVLFYSASFNAWAQKTKSDLSEIAFYNKMMGLCQLIAPIFIPIAGIVTDSLIKRSARHEDKVERLAVTLEAPAYTLILSTLCTAAMLTCKMFLTKEAIYISLIFIAISRPLLIGSQFSYVRIRFHAEHFNRLNGIYGSGVAVMCLAQYPMFVWMYSSDESFINAHLVLMALQILSFSSPGHLLFRYLSRKYAKAQLAQILASKKY